MRQGVHLLEDSDGIVISTLPLDSTCVFTGDNIEDGVARVYLTVRANRTADGAPIGEHTVALSVEAVSVLVDALEAASLDDEGQRFGNTEQIRLSEPDAAGCCCVCQRTVMELSLGFGEEDAPVRCHVDCADDLLEGLSDIWEYSDELLADHV